MVDSCSSTRVPYSSRIGPGLPQLSISNEPNTPGDALLYRVAHSTCSTEEDPGRHETKTTNRGRTVDHRDALLYRAAHSRCSTEEDPVQCEKNTALE
ncbi:unnamed protein product [Angiostrongylus costaricensis]|uniref:Uncharacterized protein n=1 Tax=Angiostrongylus costaricensis TaxID=334426 RepID=A0A0R3PIR8_ANGCS|nr:unnamed protein product [Angiostrongylus costaricensis]